MFALGIDRAFSRCYISIYKVTVGKFPVAY